jgi:hypothetical protein
MVLKPGISNDYTISGVTVALNPAMVLNITDTFVVAYSHN